MIRKEYRPIPGWSLIVFLLALPVVGFVVVRFLPDQEMMTVLGAFFAIGLLAVAVAVAPLGRAAPPALGLRPANWKYAVFGALGTLALSVAVSQLGIEPQGMKQVIEVVREPRQLVISLLLFAVLAPLVEELVFRGLIYGWVAGRWGSVPALVVSSLAFAAAHFEPAHIVLVLPLGLLFGWLRRRTDSLLPSLFSHIVNNGFALLAAVYLPNV
ncbi:MAG: CPBP family intramembrane metalloprotease [Alphaproteobacteria bacterium]|nr:MAG: CPBP family intramembrane metalloprotease [Alphaproteobacteria bacterium]